LRANVRVERTLLGSAIVQDIALYRDSPRIDFITHIDWHERHLLLKVAFPLDLRVTEARSEIQYGSITRPTQRNTSWDEARFETVAHRWVDLSESDYGVALLNDGKYGHDIHNATIRLSLLRSPTSPDPDTDQGAHDVTYSLLPHSGAWPEGDVIAHAYALNRPPLIIPAATLATPADISPSTTPFHLSPLFTSDTDGVVIEAIKRAADGDGLIVRVYEAQGARHTCRITASLALASVSETDLRERPLREGESPAYDMWRESPVASHDEPAHDEASNSWTFALRPFEIRTFRVPLARP
jgi:alpha-mannosidase